MKHSTAKIGPLHSIQPATCAMLRNSERTITGWHALLAASWARGAKPAVCQKAVTELLTDLMCFCVSSLIDFDECCRIAIADFTVESTGDAS